MTKTRGRPFAAGDKRINRAGRPVKSDTLSDCLRELASQPGPGGLTHAQKLARVLWRKAEAGDVRAAGLIADRLEGKPGQRLEVDATGQTRTSVVFEGCGGSFAEMSAAMAGRVIPRNDAPER